MGRIIDYFRRSNSAREEPKSPKVQRRPETHAPLPAQIADPNSALNVLDTLGKQFGMASSIETYTTGTLKENEVVSIETGDSARLGLIAYSCARRMKTITATQIASEIVSDAIRQREEESRAMSHVIKNQLSVIFPLVKLSEQPISDENSHNIVAELANAIESLATFAAEAGSRKLGLLVAAEFKEEHLKEKGHPSRSPPHCEKPKLHVLTAEKPSIHFDILPILSEETKQKLCQLIGSTYEVPWDPFSATLKIAYISEGLRPSIRITLCLRDDTWQEEKENPKYYSPKFSSGVEWKLSVESASFAGDSSQQIDLSELIPGTSWITGRRFAFVLQDNALIVADLGEKNP